MQRFPRQTSDLPSDTPNLSSLFSSIFSGVSSTTSSSSSSEPSSVPTSPPPSSAETTGPPSSAPSSPPPSSSDISSLPQPSNSTSVDVQPTTSELRLTPSPTLFVTLASPSESSTTTENVTTIVTNIKGQATTITSHLPTFLATSTPSISNPQRTAIIAGTTSSVFVVVLAILGGIFAYRRHKLRKFLAMSGKKKEGKSLLDGEEFDDDDTFPQHRTSYRDRAHFQSHSLARSMSPAPSLLKSRTSETGSIFREEVWPPPGFDDPIAKQSSQVDLSRIVDDVMGPGSGLAPASSASARGNVGSHERDITDASTASAQSQLSSSTMDSSSPLLASSSRARPLSAISAYNDPFGPSPSQTSVYYPTQLPPGASPPLAPGLNSPLITTSSTMSSPSASLSYPSLSHPPLTPIPSSSTATPNSISPQPHPRPISGSTQPKKSSPLARALTEDAKIWLGRLPGHTTDEREAGPSHQR